MSADATRSAERSEDDLILFSVTCLRHKGLFAYSGVLELTSSQLIFRPLAGGRRSNTNLSLLLPVEFLRSAKTMGSERHLIIRVGRDRYRFSGLQVQRFCYRLASLIAIMKNQEAPDIPHFELEERVLAFGPCLMQHPEFGRKRGELLLTQSRLRFFAYDSRRLGTLDPTPLIGIGVDQLGHFELEGIRQTLRLETLVGTTRFSGQSTVPVYALLSNLLQPSDDDDDLNEARSTMARTGPAVRIRHLRRTQGLLVIGNDSIQFVPTGLLNILLGSRQVSIPFSQLYEAKRANKTSPILKLKGEEPTVKLKLDDCEGWFEELISQLQDWLEHRTQAGDDGVPGSRLSGWRFRVNRRAIDEAPFVLPVIRRTDESLDSMMLSHHRDEVRLARLLEGPEGRFDTLEALNLSRIWDDLADKREILFTYKRERFSLCAAGGESAVESFWVRCRTPSRIFTQEYLIDQEWGPIIGPIQFIKVFTETGSSIELRPSRIMKHADGLGFILHGDPDECAFLGQEVEIHFSHPEGMCEMHSLAIWASPTPAGLSIPNRKYENYMLLVCEPPSEIRAYNARKSFRVPAVQRVMVTKLGHEENEEGVRSGLVEIDTPMEGTLANISAIGCAVYAAAELEPETFVNLTLTIDTKELRVRAKVVRCRETSIDDEPIFEYGLVFSGLERLQTNTITKAVRQVQLHLLAKQDQEG